MINHLIYKGLAAALVKGFESSSVVSLFLKSYRAEDEDFMPSFLHFYIVGSLQEEG